MRYFPDIHLHPGGPTGGTVSLHVYGKSRTLPYDASGADFNEAIDEMEHEFKVEIGMGY